MDDETYTAMVRDILALPEKLEQVLAQADRIREMATGFRPDGTTCSSSAGTWTMP